MTRGFQSTHPSWGATWLKYNQKSAILISIHAPIVGCDIMWGSSKPTAIRISIHAPIVGCDKATHEDSYKFALFQSTHPSWGATYAIIYGFSQDDISIHAPIVGCDLMLPSVSQILGTFQSTHPSWGATERTGSDVTFSKISIHAPIVGCDPVNEDMAWELIISIHAPIVGCDGDEFHQKKSVIEISIHAPIVGCDPTFNGY